MRTLEIHGQEFDSLEGFYKSLESCLIAGECTWGQNLIYCTRLYHATSTTQTIKKMM